MFAELIAGTSRCAGKKGGAHLPCSLCSWGSLGLLKLEASVVISGLSRDLDPSIASKSYFVNDL